MQFPKGIKDIYKKDEDRIVRIPANEIHPSRYQPRLRFDEEALNELAQSIQENGLIQPITVRKDEEGYEIIAGERRYRACLIAGFEEIPAYIMSPTEEQAAQMALVENIQRENLSAIEEAKSYVQIMRQGGITQEEVAKKVGKSQSAIANKIRLLNLPEDIQQGVIDGKITERHARALLKVPEDKLKKVYEKVLKEGWNVKDTEIYIQRIDNLVPKKKRRRTKGFTRNVQIAVNSVNQCVEMIEKMGIEVDAKLEETDNDVQIIINLPKE